MVMVNNFLGCLNLDSGGIMIGCWNVIWHGLVSVISLLFLISASIAHVIISEIQAAGLFGGGFPVHQAASGVGVFFTLMILIFNVAVVVMAFFCIKGVEKRKASYVLPMVILYGIAIAFSVIEFLIFIIFLPIVWIWPLFQIFFQIYFFIILVSVKQSCEENVGGNCEGFVYGAGPNNQQNEAISRIA